MSRPKGSKNGIYTKTEMEIAAKRKECSEKWRKTKRGIEVSRQYAKKYWQKHKKKCSLVNKKYWQKHKKRLIVNQRKYRFRKGKHYVQMCRYRRQKYLEKAGKLELKTIQLVYEDNIKKYGTLTCYLCEKPIQFGKDCLEHKQPISRGGTNQYDNLAIAHGSCNCKKSNKTEKEYRKTLI